MIIEALKSIFGFGPKPEAKGRSNKEDLMHQFLAESVARSPYVKSDSIDVVMAGFLQAGDKPYRIDKADLTAEGLRRGAKNSTTAVFMQAKHHLGRLEDIERIRDADFKLFSFQASNDDRDCTWCKANSGKKFPIDADIDKLIKENCTCEYCRCYLRPRRH